MTRFSRLLGLALTTYRDYEMGLSEAPVAVLKAIREKTDCNALWLLFGEEPMFGPYGRTGEASPAYGRGPAIVVRTGENIAGKLAEIEAEAGRCVAVPILGGAIAAGAPRNVYDGEVEGWAICYRSAIRHPEATSCVRVAGNSMEPWIPSGSLAFVDHAEREAARLVDRFVALRVGEGCVIRRLGRAERHFVGLPANPSPVNLPVVFGPDTEMNPVIGRVVAVFASYE